MRVSLEGPRWAEPFLARPPTKCRAMVIGPGLGTDAATQEEIRTVIARAPHPLVIDADAHHRPRRRRDGAPAPGAAARADDPHPARRRVRPGGRIAARATTAWPRPGIWPAESVPSSSSRARSPRSPAPTGWRCPDVLLASAGVPALATAGTGDVLSGVIGAFLARGVPAHLAAALGGPRPRAGRRRGRPEGLVAGDLPGLIAAWLSEDARPWLTTSSSCSGPA